MTGFKNFVQNLTDTEMASLIIDTLIRSLGDQDIDVEFDDDITDIGEKAACVVVHLTVSEQRFFAVLLVDDRGLVLQVHPNFTPKLAMIASRIGGTEEIYDDWRDAIEHPCLEGTPESKGLEVALWNAAGLCEAAPAKPDEFVVLQRITDKFIECVSLVADKMGGEVTIDLSRISKYTGAMMPVSINGTPADLHILETVNQAYVTLPGTDIILSRM